MAKQSGLFKVRGALDDYTFRKTKNGYSLGARSKLSKAQIETDPRFIRTRENGMEFGRACTSGKTMRLAFKGIIGKNKVSRRVFSVMIKCLKFDATAVRGERKVNDGLTLFEGFNFNEVGTLDNTLKADFAGAINRTTGALTVTVDPFIPNDSLLAPQGATHFKLVSVGSEIDFDTQAFVTDTASSAFLPIDNSGTTALTLATAVTAATTKPIFLVLGIHFFQEMNGVKYALNTGASDSVSVIKVDL